jgi:hypothetical protein
VELGTLHDVAAYPDLDLDRQAAAALDTLVSGYSNSVIEVVAASDLDEPVAYLCISPGQGEGMDVLPLIYAGRAADRERMISQGLDDWSSAWNPYAMRDEEDMIHPTYDEDVAEQYVALAPEVVQAWEVVRRSIEGRCLNPEYWVHGRVAHHLNRRSLPLPTIDDFAVWVFDFDAGQGDLLEMFASVLRPETFELLRERGLLGEDEEASYLA